MTTEFDDDLTMPTEAIFEPVSNRDTALALARQGFKVFPCYGADTVVYGRMKTAKSPATSRGYKSATDDQEQVISWWENHPEHIPGLHTDGLLVVDCDVDRETGKPAGEDYFRAVCDLYGGTFSGVSDTLSVTTPSGGKHLYFSLSHDQQEALPGIATGWDFHEQVGGKLSHVDLRMSGGYVIAPHSVLPDGRKYACDVPAESLMGAIKPIPLWLFNRCRKRNPELEKIPSEELAKNCGQGTVQRAEMYRRAEAKNASDRLASVAGNAVLKAECLKLATCPEGLRNSTLNEVAYTIGGKVGAHELDYREAREAILQACEACGLLAPAEFAKTMSTLERAMDDGEKDPLPSESVVKSFPVLPTSPRVPVGEATPRVPVEGAGTDADGNAPRKPLEAPQTHEKGKGKGCVAIPPFRSVSDDFGAIMTRLRNAPPPVPTGLTALDDCLSGGLPVGLTILGATPACGKSALALQVADHLAGHGVPVLYYALEMTAEELMERSIVREVFLSLCKQGNPGELLTSTDQQKSLSKAVREAMHGNYQPLHHGAVAHLHPEVLTMTAMDVYAHGAGKNLFVRDGQFGHDPVGSLPTVEGVMEDVGEFIRNNPDSPLPVVIVDYLQLLHCRDATQDRSEYDRMGAVSMGLKRLSLGGFPVVVISSFARSSYYTLPSLDSFKGSGNIEYTANAALTLGFREFVDPSLWARGEAYNRAVKEKYRGANADTPTRLELDCVKARSFQGGRREIAFYGAFYAFQPVAKKITGQDVADRYKLWDKLRKAEG